MQTSLLSISFLGYIRSLIYLWMGHLQTCYDSCCRCSSSTGLLVATVVAVSFLLTTSFLFSLYPSSTEADQDPLQNIIITDDTWLDVREGRLGRGYGDGTCRPAHNRPRLKAILKRWISIAKQHNLTWFLGYGSLIGAWRDGDLIPWDTDLDIHTFTKDNLKLDALASPRTFSAESEEFHLAMDVDWRILPVSRRRRITCDGQLLNNNYDSCTFTGPVARLIKGYELYMDMWDLEVVNGKVYERYAQGTWYEMNDIFPLKKCLYMGLEALCPRNPRVIFDAFYEKNSDMMVKKVCRNGTWLRRRIVYY